MHQKQLYFIYIIFFGLLAQNDIHANFFISQWLTLPAAIVEVKDFALKYGNIIKSNPTAQMLSVVGLCIYCFSSNKKALARTAIYAAICWMPYIIDTMIKKANEEESNAFQNGLNNIMDLNNMQYQNTLNSVEQSILNEKKYCASFTSQLDSLKTDFESINTKIKNFEVNFDKIKSNVVADIAPPLNELLKKQDEIKTNVDSLTQKLETLNKEQGTHMVEIETYNSTLSALQKEFNSMKTIIYQQNEQFKNIIAQDTTNNILLSRLSSNPLSPNASNSINAFQRLPSTTTNIKTFKSLQKKSDPQPLQ